MDLRVIKTERAIRNAFYQLLCQKPVEKITIRELADLAEINKSTFYAHYPTIYDLVDTLAQETIDELITHLDNVDMLTDDPRQFVLALYRSMDFCRSDLILIRNVSSKVFTQKLRESLAAHYQVSDTLPQEYTFMGTLGIFLFSGLAGVQHEFGWSADDPNITALADFMEAGAQGMGLTGENGAELSVKKP